MFGNKSLPISFGNSDVTKLGLKGFLFRSIKCGICLDFALVGSNGCAKCGFLICAHCEMKLGLKDINTSFPLTTISCAKCRNNYQYSVLPSLNDIIGDMQKFNDAEKLKLKIIVGKHQEMIKRNNGSAQHVKKMIKANQILKEKLDMTKCAACKTLFVNKRSNCGGCGKVSYCGSKCQRSHW
eukprot:130011_1